MLLRRLVAVLGAVLVLFPGPTAHAEVTQRAFCSGALTVLVDRSASMADHDPFGALRLAVADGLQGARSGRLGDAVRPFDARLGAAVGVDDRGWIPATEIALAGGDRGATALGEVLRAAASPSGAGGALVLVTDSESELSVDEARAANPAAIVVVGGVPSPALHAAARAIATPLLEAPDATRARRAGRSLCGVPVGPPRDASGPVRDVVLVAGLGTTTGAVRGARSSAACEPAGPLAGWCRRLVADHARVWVPSMAPRRRGGALLDSTGALDRNAAALQGFWRSAGVEGAPVLAGHSMGGLIAHAAMRRGLLAAGLVTVGSPHAGSYGADAYFAARSVARSCLLSCPVAAAELLAATVVLHRRFGDALPELTHEQRTRVDRLGQPSAPLATWAGTTSRSPALPAGLPSTSLLGGGYLSPNDGIVGVGSASGALAGLQPAVSVTNGSARHSRSVPPASAPTQLRAPEVADWLATQARGFASAHRARVIGARAGARRAPARRRVIAATLRTLTTLTPGAEQDLAGETVIVATSPIGILCDEQPISLTAIEGGLWFIDLGELGCHSLRADPSSASGSGWVLGAARDGHVGRDEIRAIRERGGRWRVVVRLAAPARVALWRGTRRIAMRAAPAGREWGGGLVLAAVIGRRGARDLTVRASVADAPSRIASIRLP